MLHEIEKPGPVSIWLGAHGDPDVDSEVETLNTVHWTAGQMQQEEPPGIENTLGLQSVWSDLSHHAGNFTRMRKRARTSNGVDDLESRERRTNDNSCKFTELVPCHSALILQCLPMKSRLLMRQTCTYFVEACRSVHFIDLGELPLEWCVATIKQHLLTCFGSPLTLDNVRSSRSMKLRDLHELVNSGELRIRSLTLGPNCRVGRVRAKRVAGLVTHGMLQSLDLGGSGCLRSAGAASLAVSLTNSPCTLSSLTSLNLRACRVGPEGAAAVARLLASADCGLLSLSLQDNSLGSEGGTSIARALAGGAQRLRSLNLMLNHLRTEGAAIVAHAVPACQSLVELNLSWNLVRSGAAEALAAAVTTGRLTALDLGFNLIRCHGAAQLATGLGGCSGLRVLSLRRNELAAEGATQLARALLSNTSLRTLDLGLNGIGPAGARLLGSVLGRNSTLRHLDLDWNALRQQGIQHLAPGLRMNRGLTHLDLSCNKLLQDGAFSLATALAGRHSERLGREHAARHLPVMRGLLLRGNAMGPWGLSILIPLLGRGHDGELDLSDNELGDTGCLLLASEGLTLLMELTALNLSGNTLTLDGLTALTTVLAKSTRLRELKLARNAISSIPPALIEIPSLASLSLHDNPLEDPPPHVVRGGLAAIRGHMRRRAAHDRKGRCGCCGLVLCLGSAQPSAAAAAEPRDDEEWGMGTDDDEGDVVLGCSQTRMAARAVDTDMARHERGRPRPRRGGGWQAEGESDSHWEGEEGEEDGVGRAVAPLCDDELERTQEDCGCFNVGLD